LLSTEKNIKQKKPESTFSPERLKTNPEYISQIRKSPGAKFKKEILE